MSLDAYAYLTRHIVPGPQDISYFVPFFIIPVALAIPRTTLSRWQSIAVFMPIVTICSLRAWSVMEGVDVISVNNLLWAAFLIALQDPWKDFRLVKHGRPPADKLVGEAYPPALPARLIWIGKLLPAIRLDYWRISHPSHDRQQPPKAGFKDAKSFLRHSAWSLLRAFLILDLSRAYIEYDNYFFDPSISVSSPLPFPVLANVPPQLFRSVVAGAQAYALIGEMFYLPAAIPAFLNSLGLLPEQYSPHSWPPYFGSPVAIFEHGVRGFWGSFWHQTMRWTTSGPGYALADGLKLRHGGLLRYAVISLSAFGLSGVVHSGLVPPEPRYLRENVNQVRLSMAAFFWTQAIAVCIEAVVGRIVTTLTGPWKQGKRRVARMAINAVWILSWFSLSLPLLMDAARQLGYWQPWPLPLSLWQWYHGRGLLAWK